MKITLVIFIVFFSIHLFCQQNLSYHGEIESDELDYLIIRDGNKLFTDKLLIGDTIFVLTDITKIDILIDKYIQIDTLDKRTLFVRLNNLSEQKSIIKRLEETINEFLSLHKHIPVPALSKRGIEKVKPNNEYTQEDMLDNQVITMLSSFNLDLIYFNSRIVKANLVDSNGKNVLTLSEGDQMIISSLKHELTPGKYYNLQLEDSENIVYEIKLFCIEKSVEEEILEDLSLIDKSVKTEYEKMIYYATYFQMISDQSKDKIYLYWLSYHTLINGISLINDDDIKVYNLLNRYVYFLDK